MPSPVTIKRMIESTGIRFADLQDACLETATSLKSFMSKNVIAKIEEVKTFKALYTTLTKAHYWNFLDTRMMEAMATASMIPATQQLVENFKKTFLARSSAGEVVPHYVPVIPLKSNHTTMIEIPDKDPRQLTIGELHKHFFT